MYVGGLVLVASLALHAEVWRALRLHALDLLALMLCVNPAISAMANGQGAYEAASASLEYFTTWASPYLLGRAYFGTLGSSLSLARGLVMAALVYVPLCLWEVRMSPQLHRQIYGFFQHSFEQHMRDGHFRPLAFLDHGLMVAMLMASSGLIAWWLWRSGALRVFHGVGMGWIAGLLMVTTFLCRSVGALVLLATGLAVLELTRRLKTPLLVLLLVAAPAAYATVRIQGTDASGLVALADEYFGAKRSESLGVRIRNEDALVARAMERPVAGWGRGNGLRIVSESGRDISVVDGLWIILIGTAGLLGLITLGLFLAAPTLALLWTVPARSWHHPAVAPAAAMAVSVSIWAVEEILNGMITPFFPLMAGAVVSFVLAASRAKAPARARSGPPLPTGSAAPA